MKKNIVTMKEFIAAIIAQTGMEFVKRKLNLAQKWPVLLDSDDWNEELWNATELHRYNVDFFIDNDLKNTSRRSLYVSDEIHFNVPSTYIKLIFLSLLRLELPTWA